MRKMRPVITLERLTDRVFDFCEEIDQYVIHVDQDETEEFVEAIRERLRQALKRAAEDLNVYVV